MNVKGNRNCKWFYQFSYIENDSLQQQIESTRFKAKLYFNKFQNLYQRTFVCLTYCSYNKPVDILKSSFKFYFILHSVFFHNVLYKVCSRKGYFKGKQALEVKYRVG